MKLLTIFRKKSSIVDVPLGTPLYFPSEKSFNPLQCDFVPTDDFSYQTQPNQVTNHVLSEVKPFLHCPNNDLERKITISTIFTDWL